jgi:TolB protein
MYRWLTVSFMAMSFSVHAALKIEILGGVENAYPIAVVPFEEKGGASPELLDKVISNDLFISGRFKTHSTLEMPQQPSLPSQVNFKAWQAKGIESLVIGQVEKLPGDRYRIDARLISVFGQEQLWGQRWEVPAINLRKVAHKISDMVFESLMGIPGAFSARIAYVKVLTQPNKRKEYILEISDSDGFNPKPMLNSSEPLMSPSWSPQGDKLAYVSFENGRSEIFIQDIASGKRQKIANFKGMNGAPAWSPDGQKMAMALSKDGNAEIYIMDLASGQLERITQHSAIDTEPAWLPDGQGLIFTSDRSGQPQLYRLRFGGQPERITFDGGYNTSASLSPDGRQVAMVSTKSGKYHIAVMDLTLPGATQDVITRTFLDESPDFSANGAVIVYASNYQNKGVLSLVSVDGRITQRVTNPEGEVREPAWENILYQQ